MSSEPGTSFDTDDYGWLADRAFKSGLREVTFTGGEPTLRNDLSEIAKVFKLKEFKVTMVTNGSMLHLRDDAVQHLDELHVSFHSFSESRWATVTNSPHSLGLVRKNIESARQKHPALPILLNVVADDSNSTPESIHRYIEFAIENNLHVKIYRESTVRTQAVQSSAMRPLLASEWWDLTQHGFSLISESAAQRVFKLDEAVISLAKTSTDEVRWTSIWLGPTGLTYVDPFHRSPDLNLSEVIAKRESKIFAEALADLTYEAKTTGFRASSSARSRAILLSKYPQLKVG